MKTKTALSHSRHQIPPASAVLLVLGALFFIAALKLLQGGQTPLQPTTDIRTTYEPYRHQAVSVAQANEETWN